MVDETQLGRVTLREFNKRMARFMLHIPEIKRIKISRWFETKKHFKFEPHGFADASKKAYAAVVYTKVHQGSLKDQF